MCSKNNQKKNVKQVVIVLFYTSALSDAVPTDINAMYQSVNNILKQQSHNLVTKSLSQSVK